MGLSDRLKAVREGLGLSQQAMADAAGVSLRSQQNYEAGLRNPDSAYLEAIAAAGGDVLYLLTGARQRYPVGQAQGQSMMAGLPASEPSDPRPEGLTPDVREAIRMVADELHAQRKHAKGVQFLELVERALRYIRQGRALERSDSRKAPHETP